MNSTKQNPLVSVIIPVYKVEAYLQRCIDSIIAQSYTNIEIILVDDGSPDLCPKICDSYAEKDNRIKVIHQNNGGLSDARNTGMNQCTGDYITFVDSDDWVDDSYIQNLLQPNFQENYDVVISDFESSINQDVKHIHSIPKKICDTKEIVKYFCQQKYPLCAWAKLYSAVFLKKHGLTFQKDLLFEDQLWSCSIATKANKIFISSSRNYHYLIREGSIMTTFCENHPQWLSSWHSILLQEKSLLQPFRIEIENEINRFFLLKISEIFTSFAANQEYFIAAFRMVQSTLEKNPIFFWAKASSSYKKFAFKLLNILPSFFSQRILYIYFKKK